MKILERRFRCDLCGKFKSRGVTERFSVWMVTTVCGDCVKAAGELLSEKARRR